MTSEDMSITDALAVWSQLANAMITAEAQSVLNTVFERMGPSATAALQSHYEAGIPAEVCLSTMAETFVHELSEALNAIA